MENKLFYDTRINNHLLVEKMSKKIRHPKNPKGRIKDRKPDRKKIFMAELWSSTFYPNQVNYESLLSENSTYNTFPIEELYDMSKFLKEPEIPKSNLPLKITFDFIFLTKSYSGIVAKNHFGKAKIVECENIKDCAFEAKFKCKSNQLKIDFILQQKVGHIIPIKISGVGVVGYAVSLIGLEIESCVDKKETAKIAKAPKFKKLKPDMSIISEEEIIDKIAI